MPEPEGLISRRSAYDAAETERRLREAAGRAGLTIFAEVDHGRNALEAGLDLRPTRLLLFGDARAGTPLMQARQTAGVDLPLKALVWVDEAGQTWLSLNDPAWIARRHGLDPALAAGMSAGVAKLLAAATA